MTIITKEEFDNLPTNLKAKFTATGDGYSLQEEDVEGLKKSKADILKEKKELQEKLDALEKFKQEFDQSKSADEELKLKAAGEFAELEKKLREKITENEQAAAARTTAMLQNLKIERLTNEFVKRGIRADRAKYVLADLADQIDLVSDENGFTLKIRNGIGDASEFDQLIEKQKAATPDFFSPNGINGSGAFGNNGADHDSKTMRRAEFEKLSPPEAMAFVKVGSIID